MVGVYQEKTRLSLSRENWGADLQGFGRYLRSYPGTPEPPPRGLTKNRSEHFEGDSESFDILCLDDFPDLGLKRLSV